ncbi:aldo/keto reductase [Streptomyces phaeochromogenes]|uniref:aldo/keto reductase n=1 Tax=Streptomyces phaeochromogenes TaxID=1923 RepID=UPI002E2B967C|nr:aldo/keto reductase [Streptomyces phaeochromogenes]
MTKNPPAGQIEIAGKIVPRLGLSTLHLAGRGRYAWGAPGARSAALELLRTAVHDLGINLIDTSDAYGPHVVEELIREALAPYPEDLLISTKVGMVRPTPDSWSPVGKPAYLRAAVEGSLRRLGVDSLDLCYLHRIDPEVAVPDQIEVLDALRDEGKIRYIGIADAPPEDVRWASHYARIDVVQSPLNLKNQDDPLLGICQDAGIPYVAGQPLCSGELAEDLSTALSWVLNQGEHVAAIPGTSSATHLEELVRAVAGLDNHLSDSGTTTRGP